MLDFLAFEFSWFVCYRFDSPSEISVGDWSLIETVRLATNMQCIKTFLKENGAAQADITEVPVDAVMAYRRADAYRMPAQASFGASIDAASSGSDAVTSAFDSYRKSFAGRNASTRLLFMEDAFVSGTGIVFTPRSIVKDSSYLYDIHARSVWGAIHRGTSRQLLLSPDCYDVCVVGLNAAAGNYYHWISQCLVAIQTGIEASRKRQAVRIAVLVPTLNQWQKDSLDALLGDSRGLRVIQLKLSEFVHVHHALYVSTLGEDAPFFNHAERAITATVIKKALRLTPRLPSHGIYISRRDTGKRRIVNELDLIAALAQFGIHEVVMSQLPFTDQIGVIHGAGLVVGAHGAGLTNIMFAQPGAMLYEIHQAGYLNPCMLRLAHSVGAHYISDIFCEATSEKFSHAGDWRVDVATIVATIRRIAAAWNTLDVASEARGGEAQ